MVGQGGTGPTEDPQLFGAPVRDQMCYRGAQSVAITQYLCTLSKALSLLPC